LVSAGSAGSGGLADAAAGSGTAIGLRISPPLFSQLMGGMVPPPLSTAALPPMAVVAGRPGPFVLPTALPPVTTGGASDSTESQQQQLAAGSFTGGFGFAINPAPVVIGSASSGGVGLVINTASGPNSLPLGGFNLHLTAAASAQSQSVLAAAGGTQRLSASAAGLAAALQQLQLNTQAGSMAPAVLPAVRLPLSDASAGAGSAATPIMFSMSPLSASNIAGPLGTDSGRNTASGRVSTNDRDHGVSSPLASSGTPNASTFALSPTSPVIHAAPMGHGGGGVMAGSFPRGSFSNASGLGGLVASSRLSYHGGAASVGVSTPGSGNGSGVGSEGSHRPAIIAPPKFTVAEVISVILNTHRSLATPNGSRSAAASPTMSARIAGSAPPSASQPQGAAAWGVGASLAAGSGGADAAAVHAAASLSPNTLSSPSAAAGADAVPLLLSLDPLQYDLRISEDDGAVDFDFPPCDSAVPITHIGVDKFVLCEGATDRPILRISIPASAVTSRPCENDPSMVVPEMAVSCYWIATHGGPHGQALRPFAAKLTGAPVPAML
jgi:hypothetical protein